MQEARYEEQPNGGSWRVWLHPSDRQLAVYSDEEEARDVVQVITLKMRINAGLSIDGLDADLTASELEHITAMTMEELLERVLPGNPDMEPIATDGGMQQHQDGTQQYAEKEADRGDANAIKDNDDAGKRQSEDADLSTDPTPGPQDSIDVNNHNEEDEDEDEDEAVGVSDVDWIKKVAEDPSSYEDSPFAVLDFWIANSDGSYSRPLPPNFHTSNKKLKITEKMRKEVVRASRDRLNFTLITKSTDPALDGKRFDVGFSSASEAWKRNEVNRQLNPVADSLNLKAFDIITLQRGPEVGQVYLSVKPCARSDSRGTKPADKFAMKLRGLVKPEYYPSHTPICWTTNSDGSYSRPLSSNMCGESGKCVLNLSREMKEKLGADYQTFTMITKSQSRDLDGKRFRVGFGLSQVNCITSFRPVVNFLSMKAGDTITLRKGPKLGEVYVSVINSKKPASSEKKATAHQNTASGTTQKRQRMPLPANHTRPIPLAKKQKPTVTTPPPVPTLNQQQQQRQQQQPQIPSARREPSSIIRIQSSTRAERSPAEMWSLVEAIIKKEGVGLTQAEIMAFISKFVYKMKPEMRETSLQILEKQDAAGEHEGVKLFVQMSLQDLN